jgi:hypothetical protein
MTAAGVASSSVAERPTGAVLWAGRVLGGIAAIFLLLDGITHLLRLHQVVQSFADLGYPIGLARPLGALELACLLLYAVPRTSLLGAVLLTGYLGGAMSAHVRLEDPLLGTVLFPVYLGAMLWFGLWVRDARLRTALGRPARA